MKTKAKRIIDLFNYVWPSERWHVQSETVGQTTASIKIRTTDHMAVLASLHFELNLGTSDESMIEVKTPAYRIDVNYPAFNGTVAELEEHAAVIALLGPAIASMSKTPLIQKGE